MPEEINRVLTDHLADQLFAPTETAAANLKREGIREGSIHLVGDVMYDVSIAFGEIAQRRSEIVSRLDLLVGRFALATIHRAENTDNPRRLRDILSALGAVGRELQVVLPLHPRTRDRLGGEVERLVGGSRVTVIDPVGYLDMIQLERNARVILTDSGGVQKEAYFFGVPCVTLRTETEWVELLASGWNVLWPPTADATTLLEIIRSFEVMPPAGRPPLYGDGTAAEAIAVLLADAG
jgi:UDP-GlcNAc3NAcA epimerase